MIHLTIAERLMTDMDRHAVAAYPEECCGVLVGRRAMSGAGERATVSLVIRARNIHDGSRFRRFTIAPEDLLRAHKRARQRGQEVVGYYHSHPDRAAVPSDHDRSAADPGVSHLILAVRRDRVVARRSWHLPVDGSHFEEERLV